MRLTEVSMTRLTKAVEVAGMDIPVQEAVDNFLSDTYWNDPKCARRFILANNGDPVRFFDSLPEVDWGE